MSSNLTITKICEHCGQNFTARKLTTRFCSHKCSQQSYKAKKRGVFIDQTVLSNTDKFHNEEKKSTQVNPLTIDKPILNMSDIMSISDVARLFGNERTTVYRYCVNNQLKCIKMNRKVYIRRKDIDELFDNAPPYQVTHAPERTKKTKGNAGRVEGKDKIDSGQVQSSKVDNNNQLELSDYCTADDIASKYGYSKSAVHKNAALHNIEKLKMGNQFLYKKEQIEAIYAPKKADDTIDSWYTVEDIKTKFQMSTTAVYSFASEQYITRKNFQGKTLYAASEVDEALAGRLGDPTIQEWYTKDEIIAQFGFSDGYLANFIYKHKIPRKRLASVSYYSKVHFDEAVKGKIFPTIFISIEEAIKEYGVSRNTIYNMINTHDIPKIKSGKITKLNKLALEKIFNNQKLHDNGKAYSTSGEI